MIADSKVGLGACRWLTYFATHQDSDSVLIGHFVHFKEIHDLLVVLLQFHQGSVVSVIVAENEQICIRIGLDVLKRIISHSAIFEASWRVKYFEIKRFLIHMVLLLVSLVLSGLLLRWVEFVVPHKVSDERRLSYALS